MPQGHSGQEVIRITWWFRVTRSFRITKSFGVMKLHIITKKFSARNMGSGSRSHSWSLIHSSFHKVIYGKKGHSWHFGSGGLSWLRGHWDHEVIHGHDQITGHEVIQDVILDHQGSRSHLESSDHSRWRGFQGEEVFQGHEVLQCHSRSFRSLEVFRVTR